VRGHEEAGGHAVEIARRGSLALPDRAWVLAGNVAEGAAESAQALPPGLEGNLGDGEIGIAEQRGRALDTPREQVTVRRQAEGLLERSREVGLGDAAYLRKTAHRPVFVRGGVHPVFCAQQAAQQCRVLA
jgi:hypothetical protein